MTVDPVPPHTPASTPTPAAPFGPRKTRAVVKQLGPIEMMEEEDREPELVQKETDQCKMKDLTCTGQRKMKEKKELDIFSQYETTERMKAK
jgi:hypothetical protein